MTAELLFGVRKKLVLGLEVIFKVVVVVTDNNSINKKCMSHFNNPKANFVYSHPMDPLRPLFFLQLILCT